MARRSPRRATRPAPITWLMEDRWPDAIAAGMTVTTWSPGRDRETRAPSPNPPPRGVCAPSKRAGPVGGQVAGPGSLSPRGFESAADTPVMPHTRRIPRLPPQLHAAMDGPRPFQADRDGGHRRGLHNPPANHP